MKGHKISLQLFHLFGNFLIRHGEEELFRGQGNIFIALNAAQNKFTLIGFENNAPVGEFLKQPGPVPDGIGEIEFPVYKDGADYYHHRNKPNQKFSHFSTFLGLYKHTNSGRIYK